MEQSIETILRVRGTLIKYFKQHEAVIVFVLKFLVGLFVFSIIHKIGFYRETFAPLYEGGLKTPFWLMLGLLFVILPPSLAQSLVVLDIVMQTSASIEVAVLVLLLLALVVLLYTRLDPERSYLVIAIVLGFYLKIPYAVVIFAGLYCGITAIIPITIGTCINQSLPFFQQLLTEQVANATGEIDIMSLPLSFLDIFKSVFSEFSGNLNWIAIAFVFAMVILAVYALSLLSFDYNKDIAICGGGVLGMVCMLVCTSIIKLGISYFTIIISSIISILLMMIVRFFDCVLDYRRVERVQFEDDNSYYYVKIVPKVNVPLEEEEFEPEQEAVISVPRKAPPRTKDGELPVRTREHSARAEASPPRRAEHSQEAATRATEPHSSRTEGESPGAAEVRRARADAEARRSARVRPVEREKAPEGTRKAKLSSDTMQMPRMSSTPKAERPSGEIKEDK